MKIKFLVDEDFVNYKKPSMFIGFPHCNMKCGKEFCQNAALLDEPDIEIEISEIVDRYLSNDITKAIVCGGMEPFDDAEDLFTLLKEFRKFTKDDIVIYTGYYGEEIIKEVWEGLAQLENIIVKFGRYKPNQPSHFDDVLGVNLCSDNQFAVKLILKD